MLMLEQAGRLEVVTVLWDGCMGWVLTVGAV